MAGWYWHTKSLSNSSDPELIQVGERDGQVDHQTDK